MLGGMACREWWYWRGGVYWGWGSSGSGDTVGDDGRVAGGEVACSLMSCCLAFKTSEVEDWGSGSLMVSLSNHIILQNKTAQFQKNV